VDGAFEVLRSGLVGSLFLCWAWRAEWLVCARGRRGVLEVVVLANL
jgi:hypothetical protein